MPIHTCAAPAYPTHRLMEGLNAAGYDCGGISTSAGVSSVHVAEGTDMTALAAFIASYEPGPEPVPTRVEQATIIPTPGQILDLGTSEARWGDVYATSVITLSDQNRKRDIEPLTSPSASHLIMNLQPVSYRFKDFDGGRYGPQSHNRLHMGFLAQQLREVLDSDEYGVWCRDAAGNESIRYEELIAPMVKLLQAQGQKIEQLEAQVEYACETIAAIQKVLRERPPI